MENLHWRICLEPLSGTNYDQPMLLVLMARAISIKSVKIIMVALIQNSFYKKLLIVQERYGETKKSKKKLKKIRTQINFKTKL